MISVLIVALLGQPVRTSTVLEAESVRWAANATCAGDLTRRECELLIAGLDLEQEVYDLKVQIAELHVRLASAQRTINLCKKETIAAAVPPCLEPEPEWSWSACAVCGAVASGLAAGVTAYGAVQICR